MKRKDVEPAKICKEHLDMAKHFTFDGLNWFNFLNEWLRTVEDKKFWEALPRVHLILGRE
jgi:hypothetical protein